MKLLVGATGAKLVRMETTMSVVPLQMVCLVMGVTVMYHGFFNTTLNSAMKKDLVGLCFLVVLAWVGSDA